MWTKILMLLRGGRFNSIRQSSAQSIPTSLYKCLSTNIYYTPKVQKLPFSKELASYLRYLQRKSIITNDDLKQMVNNILIQYGHIHGLENSDKFRDNLEYGIAKDVYIPPNVLCPYEGVTDWVVGLNSTHFFPIMFYENVVNPAAGATLAYANMIQKANVRKDVKTSGYALLTTGNEWQLFKIYRDMTLEKTTIYEGRNQYRTLYNDFQMVEVVLGLIDICLETERIEVQVLKNAYDLLDERKNMLQAKTVEEAQQASPMSKLLVRYEKKKDQWNSK